jgi:hypothetical protein
MPTLQILQAPLAWKQTFLHICTPALWKLCKANFRLLFVPQCESSSAGRASPCQGEGREFEPRLSLKVAPRFCEAFCFFVPFVSFVFVSFVPVPLLRQDWLARCAEYFVALHSQLCRSVALWRGARVVESVGLENRCSRKTTVGSNPTLSAPLSPHNFTENRNSSDTEKPLNQRKITTYSTFYLAPKNFANLSKLFTLTQTVSVFEKQKRDYTSPCDL